MTTLFCFVFILFVLPLNAEISPGSRIDCIPDFPLLNKKLCQQRGCLWDPSENAEYPKTPQCYFPENTGYKIKKQADNAAILVPAEGSPANPFGKNFEKLQFTYTTLGAAVKVVISPVGVERYRPPVPLKEPIIEASEALSVSISNDTDLFAFQ
uniref:P-type domain-containing protein n=1 Tax=Panagrellus redivivus TaxID=6233 RepID=A0A7E4ZV56_PANRE